MIFPLPVMKNKFGENVAYISLEDYYRQIMEEVSEAHTGAIIASFVDILQNDDWGQCVAFFNCNEPEELVDIITCCITRFDIKHQFDDEPFDVESVVADALKRYRDSRKGDFYIELASKVMYAFNAAKTADWVEELLLDSESGCNSCVIEFELDADEETLLANIIAMCITRLEILGYNADARQKLYQAVNDKNRKRGYFDD